MNSNLFARVRSIAALQILVFLCVSGDAAESPRLPAETDARFKNDPRYAGEVARYLRLAKGAGRDEYLSGGYAHQMARDAEHPLGTWRVMRVDDRGPKRWQDMLSFDALAKDEGTRWQFRPDWLNPTCDVRIGTRCLLALSPDGGDKPVGELASAIDDNFGSFDKFTAHFTAAALGVQGSGWAALVWDSIGEKLLISQFFDQQSNFAAGTVPVLMLDVWEHAYYLDYKNVRADYVKAFWNIANWANVQQRFDVAREKTNGLLVLS